MRHALGTIALGLLFSLVVLVVLILTFMLLWVSPVPF